MTWSDHGASTCLPCSETCTSCYGSIPDCTGCKAGYGLNDNGECVECPYGTYQDEDGGVKYKECPEMTHTNEKKSVKCKPCITSC